MLGNLFVLLVLLLINAFFASAEIAVLNMSASLHRLEVDDGDKKTRLLLKLAADEGRFLATVQIAVTFVGLFSGAFAAEAFSGQLTDFVLKLFPSLSYSTVNGVAVVVLTIVLTYFSIVIGELVPKKLAIRNSEKVARAVVNTVYFVSVATKPLVSLLTSSANIVLRLFGVDPHKKEAEVTEEEIKKLLEVSEESGNIDESEKVMINNIFDFDTLTVNDISTHRTDIVALASDAPIEEIIRVLTKERFSRIPVYQDNIDDIIGVINVRDFLNYITGAENRKTDFNITKILRKPIYVPITKSTVELFGEMKKTKIHFAVVVDEYGGTAGIVTMEDIIEEIMGNILDEYDEEEKPEIEEIDSNTFIINGTADLSDISEHLGVKLPSDDYDTVSGFVIGQIGRIPEEGEQPEFDYENLVFKVLKVEDRRITYVTVNKV